MRASTRLLPAACAVDGCDVDSNARRHARQLMTALGKFRAGKAPRAVKLGVCLLFVYWATVAFDFILVYSTSRSDDHILAVHGAIELLGLENYPMMGVWLCAAYQFGMKLGHLVDVEKTEERLRNAEGGAHAFGPTSKVCPAEPELESE